MLTELEKIYHYYNDNSWDYHALSINPSMTWNTISLTNERWVKSQLVKNPNTTLSLFQKYKKSHKLKRSYLLHNQSISYKEYLSVYDFEHDTLHPKCPIDIVFQDIKPNTSKIDWSFIVCNQNITIEMLLPYIRNSWYGDILNNLLNNDTVDITKYLTIIKWNMTHLSKHPKITFDIIQKYRQLEWCPFGLAKNVNLYEKQYQCFVSRDYWYLYAQNKNILIHDIFLNLDIYDCPFYVSMNPSITLTFMKQHSDYPWNFKGLSLNPLNVSIDKAAKTIQQKYLNWYYKPICKDGTPGLCIKRNLRELNQDGLI